MLICITLILTNLYNGVKTKLVPIAFLYPVHTFPNHSQPLSFPTSLVNVDKEGTAAVIGSATNQEQLTASTRPFSVGFFSIRASNTSSVSLRTYSRTMWRKNKEGVYSTSDIKSSGSKLVHMCGFVLILHAWSTRTHKNPPVNLQTWNVFPARQHGDSTHMDTQNERTTSHSLHTVVSK